MKPLVSILIPAYNSGQWLGDALTSAIRQDWPRTEIIVVDDGSTDDTLKVAQSFPSDRVKVLSQENRGACHARNRALAESQGDFIQWLDADDLLAPDKLSRQLRCSDGSADTRCLFSASWGRFYFSPHCARFQPGPLWQDHTPIDWLVTRLGNSGLMPNHAWLVSRKLTELAGPWDERLLRNQDGEYFTRVVAASGEVKFVAEARCYYRKANPRSITHNWTPQARQSLFLSVDLTTRRLLALEDSPRTRRVCIRWFHYLMKECYPEANDLVEAARLRIEDLGGSPEPVDSTSAIGRFIGRRGIGGAKWLKGAISRAKMRWACEWERRKVQLTGMGRLP